MPSPRVELESELCDLTRALERAEGQRRLCKSAIAVLEERVEADENAYKHHSSNVTHMKSKSADVVDLEEFKVSRSTRDLTKVTLDNARAELANAYSKLAKVDAFATDANTRVAAIRVSLAAYVQVIKFP